LGFIHVVAQLMKMKVPGAPCLKIPPYRGVFQNCQGVLMPPPPPGGTFFA
jgi:hypothetical protein